jgi:hypothetical protein
LFLEGQQALDAGDYPTAADRFERAEKLYHAPTIVLGLARAYKALRRYVEARERYNQVIREQLPAGASDAFRKAQEDARAEISSVEGQIGWVTLRITGPDEPVVMIDAEQVPPASLGVRRAVNPGQHAVKVSAPGWHPAETTFAVAAGQAQEVKLTLEENPDDPALSSVGGSDSTMDTLRLVGFVGIGVGAVGLIVGGITGGLAIGKHSELEDNCPNNQCPPEQQDNLDSFETMGTVSTVGFIAGGVLAAAGIALVVVSYTVGGDAPSEPAAARFEAEVGPSSARARLRF